MAEFTMIRMPSVSLLGTRMPLCLRTMTNFRLQFYSPQFTFFVHYTTRNFIQKFVLACTIIDDQVDLHRPILDTFHPVQFTMHGHERPINPCATQTLICRNPQITSTLVATILFQDQDSRKNRERNQANGNCNFQ